MAPAPSALVERGAAEPERSAANPMIASAAGADYANGLEFRMRFIESPVFTASLRRHLDDAQYRAMQAALSLRPEQGALIPGGAGLRKLRGGAEGRGKRGGVRTIYF
jgi:hypothetical protein